MYVSDYESDLSFGTRTRPCAFSAYCLCTAGCSFIVKCYLSALDLSLACIFGTLLVQLTGRQMGPSSAHRRIIIFVALDPTCIWHCCNGAWCCWS